MPDALTLADARLTLALNHILAAHPTFFRPVLLLSEHGANLLLLLALAALWFRRAPLGSSPLVAPKSSTPPPETMAFFGRTFSGDATRLRLENHARIVAVALAILAAYFLALMLAQRFGIERPFATFYPIRAPRGAFDGVSLYGAMPSETAVLLGALPAALFAWSRWLGWGGIVVAIALGVARVAAGLNYPLDMIVGALMGVAAVAFALRRQMQPGSFRNAMNRVACGFEPVVAPLNYLFWGLSLLLAIEFVLHLNHVMHALQSISSDFTIIPPITRQR